MGNEALAIVRGRIERMMRSVLPFPCITTKEHPTLKGELSAEYKAFLEGKGR